MVSKRRGQVYEEKDGCRGSELEEEEWPSEPMAG